MERLSKYEFVKSARSNGSAEGGCVSWATNVPGHVAIADDKVTDGPVFEVAPAAFDALAAEVLKG